MAPEITAKRRRVVEWLAGRDLDGVLLWTRGNFAWATGGRDNHIANNSSVGVAGVLMTAERATCVCSNIEAPRLRAEELADCGMDVIEYPWHDGRGSVEVVRDLLGKSRIAADADPLGMDLRPLPEDFAELRWSLTDGEIARYRDGGRRAAAAMEATCRELRPGMSGHEIAGLLDHRLHSAGMTPLVTLVAVDAQVERFRHPIPKQVRLERCAMLVSCASFGGLVSALTRFVHFGAVPAELRRRQRAVSEIDAAVQSASRPGRTLGDIFAELQEAYTRQGFADEWRLHHQGGSIGYANRDVVAKPGSMVTVRDRQAFAWNPSITGAKSEDTILVANAGAPEVLTSCSADWPTIPCDTAEGVLMRPDVLVV